MSVAVGGIVAEGRVDRIDRRGDELVVVDYKTGRPPTAEDARQSRALALYALGAERTLRRRCVEVELHHLPSGAGRGVAARPGVAGARTSRAAERSAAALAAAAEDLAAGADPETRCSRPARAPLRVLRRAATLPGGPRRGTGERAVGAAGPVSRDHRPAVSAPSAGGGGLRGLSGVLAAGMVALVVGLVVAWVVALREGSHRARGAATLLVHAATAVVAVVAQVYADRTPGARGALVAAGVIVLVGAVLTVEWLV